MHGLAGPDSIDDDFTRASLLDRPTLLDLLDGRACPTYIQSKTAPWSLARRSLVRYALPCSALILYRLFPR